LPAPLRRAAAALGHLLPEPAGGGLGVYRLKRFLRVARDEATPVDRYLGLLSKSDDRERRELYAPELGALVPGGSARERLRLLHRDAGAPSGLPAALYLDYKVYLADDILALSDRLSMAHSLEVRVPLVDHRLVEHVFPLPTRLKLGRWETKRLLKRALASRLPRAHLTAPKRGFVGPTASWLRHELRPMLEDELSAARLGRLGYFNARTVARRLAEHGTGRHNHEGALWALLCFSTWHRLYVERPPAPQYMAARPSPALATRVG
jgi:asparagine synthase (glutamine-hydrolysing)